MNINAEIWKLFEDNHLVTYAFGDMGLFNSRAKGKVVIFKKTGDIYLVEKTDKTLSSNEFENFYLPGIRDLLTYYRSKGAYPDKVSIQDFSSQEDKKGILNWRNAVRTDAVKDKLDKVLVALIASSSDGFTKMIGTGFIVVAAGRKALMITAFSNFYLHGLIQKPKRQHRSTNASEFNIHPGELFPVDKDKIRAVYQHGHYVDPCIIAGVSVVPELDIALCAIEFQNEYTGPNFSYQLGLDSRPPSIDEEVVAIGFSGITTDWQPGGKNLKDQYAQLMQKKEMRIGKVTGIFNNGSRKPAWPHFETTIPVDQAMRGGPVFPFAQTGLKMNVCAVISKDMSNITAFRNFSVRGRSLMAMIWPSLMLPFGVEEKPKKQAAENNLLGLIKKGRVKDAGEADKKIKIVQKDPKTLAISIKGR